MGLVKWIQILILLKICSDEHNCLRANYEIWNFGVGTLINDDKTQGIGGGFQMGRNENVNKIG